MDEELDLHDGAANGRAKCSLRAPPPWKARERERAQANIRRVSQGANGTGSISWIGGAAAPDGMDVLTAETEKRVRRPQPQWEEEEEEDYKQ